jgi:anti-sigma factor RsiW
MSPDESSRQKCCAEGSTILSDYHDGRFADGSEQAGKVESHLATCPKCAEMLEDYRTISAAAQLLRDCGSDCLDLVRLRASVERGVRRATFVSRLAWAGAGLSAAAAVAATVIALLLPGGGGASPPLAEDREKAIEQIMAELKSEPVDIDDVRMRGAIWRRLQEEDLFGRAAIPREWVPLLEEAELRGPTLDVDELLQKAIRARRRGEAVRVDVDER